MKMRRWNEALTSIDWALKIKPDIVQVRGRDGVILLGLLALFAVVALVVLACFYLR
jgi:hypothetical protein